LRQFDQWFVRVLQSGYTLAFRAIFRHSFATHGIARALQRTSRCLGSRDFFMIDFGNLCDRINPFPPKGELRNNAA